MFSTLTVACGTPQWELGGETGTEGEMPEATKLLLGKVDFGVSFREGRFSS